LKTFNVGIVAPNNETAESLKTGITATGMATVVIQSSEYYSSKSDWAVRRFAEANPEIVILEIRDQAAALRCLKVLHSVLPKTHFLVASHLTDPQLIIEAMRSGAREFVPLPVTAATLSQAFTRYVGETEQRGTDHAKRGKLYSVISAKPGSGATTVALNLAGIIADGGKARVGFLDMYQPVGDAAAYLNLKPIYTITEAIAAVHRLDPVLLESFTTPSHGFHVLSGFREYMPASQFTVEAMTQILDVSMHSFAHTFADLSEYIVEDQAQAISSMSAAILLVITPDVPSIWRTERLLNSLAKTNASGKIKIVLNRKSKTDQISEADIDKLLKHPVDFILPNDYAASMKALNSGRLLDAKEGKYLARAYRELAEQIAGLPAETRRGLLSMFLKPSSAGGINNG
jgi:pilus assembly protein CpaE